MVPQIEMEEPKKRQSPVSVVSVKALHGLTEKAQTNGRALAAQATGEPAPIVEKPLRVYFIR